MTHPKLLKFFKFYQDKMQIPIENIYYLLCYAWNKLDEKERVNVSVESKMSLLDLFAKVLLKATKQLLKRGIDRNYIEHLEEMAGVKGKIQISQTIKSNLLFAQKTICIYDDMSSNIIMNRILVTTLDRLSRTKGLDKKLKNEAANLRRMLFDVESIEITYSLFQNIKLNRNNRFYGFVMNICQIIFENTLPSEVRGRYRFLDFTRDVKKMNQLFEEFVRSFYRIEQKVYKIVKREIINWQFESTENEGVRYLPQMKTDITLESDDNKIIVDAKYYQETMPMYYDSKKIRSDNLYQLFSYLLNQQKDELKTKTATGILLYPTIDEEYDLSYKYQDHTIQIKTVNLNTHWKDIHDRLLNIVNIP